MCSGSKAVYVLQSSCPTHLDTWRQDERLDSQSMMFFSLRAGLLSSPNLCSVREQPSLVLLMTCLCFLTYMLFGFQVSTSQCALSYKRAITSFALSQAIKACTPLQVFRCVRLCACVCLCVWVCVCLCTCVCAISLVRGYRRPVICGLLLSWWVHGGA